MFSSAAAVYVFKHLGVFSSTWSCFQALGRVFKHLGVFSSTWACFQALGRVFKHLGVFSSTWACFQALGRVFKHLGVFSSTWACFQALGRVFKHLGVFSSTWACFQAFPRTFKHPVMISNEFGSDRQRAEFREGTYVIAFRVRPVCSSQSLTSLTSVTVGTKQTSVSTGGTIGLHCDRSIQKECTTEDVRCMHYKWRRECQNSRSFTV